MHYFVATLLLAVALVPAAVRADVTDTKPNQHLRLQYAKSSETDFLTVVVGDYQESPESNYLLGATWGIDISDTLFGLPVPMSAHVGMQYFNERGYQHDAYGATAFIKASYDFRLPFTQTRLRVGLGEGLSYVTRVPMSEQRDFAKKGVESNKLMNYMEWTMDLPLAQFAAVEPLLRGRVEDLSVGFVVWHRSSVFGLFADDKGGVNFMGLGVEAKF